jgi:hypothetical protein
VLVARAIDDDRPASTLYEEFHPFGTSSYAANDAGANARP